MAAATPVAMKSAVPKAKAKAASAKVQEAAKASAAVAAPAATPPGPTALLLKAAAPAAPEGKGQKRKDLGSRMDVAKVAKLTFPPPEAKPAMPTDDQPAAYRMGYIYNKENAKMKFWRVHLPSQVYPGGGNSWSREFGRPGVPADEGKKQQKFAEALELIDKTLGEVSQAAQALVSSSS